MAQILKVKGCHVVSCRTRLTLGGFLFSLLLLVFFAGCNEREPGSIHIVHFDEAAFHKVLTLFFDGVPPLDDEMVETGAGNIDPNVPGVPKRPDVDWYIHEPLNDCARCHGSQRGRNFSREVQLTAKVPQLCYECHDPVVPAASEGWMHGPAAAGECLLCHDPHKTTNPHLLREQIPSLCYKCHPGIAGESTPDNVKEPHSQCIACHAAHASPTEGSTGRVPELCYECHESLAPAALKGWVHGPVAVGQCQLCHEPHKTGNQHLLRERTPALCYGCHEEESVKSIADHWRESYVDCGNCHEGHVSPEQHLLRRSRQRESVEVEAAESVSGPSGQ